MDCIFCKIVAGDMPATVVYEDEHTLAFLDIAPLVSGHTLVIPKQHVDPITMASPAILSACIHTAQVVAKAQEEALHANGINLHQANGRAAGQMVPHLHFHVIPRFDDDGHHWNWHGHAYQDAAAMHAMGQRIKQIIART